MCQHEGERPAYCLNCRMLICDDCCVDHIEKRHELKVLGDIMAARQRELGQYKEEFLRKLEDCRSRVQALQKDSTTTMTRLEKEIETQMASLCHDINGTLTAARDELVKSLTQILSHIDAESKCESLRAEEEQTSMLVTNHKYLELINLAQVSVQHKFQGHHLVFSALTAQIADVKDKYEAYIKDSHDALAVLQMWIKRSEGKLTDRQKKKLTLIQDNEDVTYQQRQRIKAMVATNVGLLNESTALKDLRIELRNRVQMLQQQIATLQTELKSLEEKQLAADEKLKVLKQNIKDRQEESHSLEHIYMMKKELLRDIERQLAAIVENPSHAVSRPNPNPSSGPAMTPTSMTPMTPPVSSTGSMGSWTSASSMTAGSIVSGTSSVGGTAEQRTQAIVKKAKEELQVAQVQQEQLMLQSKFVHCFDPKTNVIYIYHIEASKIFRLSAKDSHIATNHDSVQIKNQICLSGGFDATAIQFVKATYMIEVVNNEVIEKSQRANMNVAKSQHKLVALTTNIVYSLGGKNQEEKCLNVCERFDIAANKWTRTANMNERKFYVSAASLNCVSLYVFGGYNGAAVNTIEELHPNVEDRWKILKLASATGWTPRDETASFQRSENEILVFGGIDTSGGCTDEVYSLDVKARTLTRCEHSLAKREWFTIRSTSRCNDLVYIFGYFTKDLHVYSLSARSWSLIPEAQWHYSKP
jgi:hypothetical protein